MAPYGGSRRCRVQKFICSQHESQKIALNSHGSWTPGMLSTAMNISCRNSANPLIAKVSSCLVAIWPWKTITCGRKTRSAEQIGRPCTFDRDGPAHSGQIRSGD